MTESVSRVLFEPIQIGPYELPGRVFKSATSETRADEKGFVTDRLLEYYEPIAAAKTPMIVTGNLYVSPQGCSTHLEAGIDADDKIPGLRDWAAVGHRHGCCMVAQLNHAGRQVVTLAPGVEHAVSASDVREPLMGTKPKPLTQDGIKQVVADFAAAAERAAEAEMDGVQIHMAHGYLLGQFLTPHTNRRRDEYGGSVENRARIVVEILRAIRERVGDDYLVIGKINGTDALPLRCGATTADLVKVAKMLQEEGLDAIEISRGHYESGPTMIPGQFDGFLRTILNEGGGQELSSWRKAGAAAAAPLIDRVAERLWPLEEGFNLPQAEKFTKALDIPVIAVGGFHTADGMQQAIESGSCNAVSVARAMIADPFLYRHLRWPEPEFTRACVFNNGCIARAGGRPIDCYAPEPTATPKVRG